MHSNVTYPSHKKAMRTYAYHAEYINYGLLRGPSPSPPGYDRSQDQCERIGGGSDVYFGQRASRQNYFCARCVVGAKRNVDVAANAGLLQNPGTMSPQNIRGILLEVPMVSGTGGVSAAAGRQAGATAPTVHLQWV